MKKFILSLAVVALAWGCATDETSDIQQLVGDKTTIEAELASVRTHMAEDGFKVLWSKGDQIGVVLADATIVPFTLKEEFAGQSSGLFEGTLAEGAEVKSAIYPYSASGVTIACEQSVASTSTDISAGDVAVATLVDGKLSFTSKVALFAVSFKNVEGSAIAGKKIQTVKVATNDKAISGAFTLDLANASAALTHTAGYQYVDLVYTDTPELSSELNGYLALNPNVATDDEIRVYVKADDVWYGYTTKAKADLVAGKRYNFAIDAAQCVYVPALVWAYGGAGVIPRFTGAVPAVDKDGNVYTTVNGDKHLYKIDKTGKLVWKVELTSSDTVNSSATIDPSGNVIYINHGTNTFKAINANDGSTKWTFTDFFAYGSATAAGTPSASTSETATAVGDTNVYLGNGGTTGTILAINKETGKRVSYLTQSVSNLNGPTGGTKSGVALYGGVVTAFNKYCCAHGAHQSLFDSPQHNSDVYGPYVPMTYEADYSWNMNNDNGGCVGVEIDGKKCIAFMGLEKTSSDTYNWRVAANAIDPYDASFPDMSTAVHAYDYQYTLKGVNSSNAEAALTVGPQNELIITNKKGGGTNGGGVYGIQLGSTNKLLWSFKPDTDCDCVGGVVADKEGNIHIHSDDTYYYIVKPNYTNGSVTKLAKANYRYLAADFGYAKAGEYGWTRAWTSGTMGLDGKYYLGCQFNVTAGGNCGMLLCIEYGGTTGISETSSWPMHYGNPYHTCTSHPELLQKLGLNK